MASAFPRRATFQLPVPLLAILIATLVFADLVSGLSTLKSLDQSSLRYGEPLFLLSANHSEGGITGNEDSWGFLRVSSPVYSVFSLAPTPDSKAKIGDIVYTNDTLFVQNYVPQATPENILYWTWLEGSGLPMKLLMMSSVNIFEFKIFRSSTTVSSYHFVSRLYGSDTFYRGLTRYAMGIQNFVALENEAGPGDLPIVFQRASPSSAVV